MHWSIPNAPTVATSRYSHGSPRRAARRWCSCGTSTRTRGAWSIARGPSRRHWRRSARRRCRWRCRDLGALPQGRPARRRPATAWSRGRRTRTAGARMTPIALTIAGSDSGGGAGIQADLKTFSALGVYGASVITALTAQNTKGVSAIHNVPADFVTAQMDAVFSDLDIDAVKIGMVSQRAVIEAIAAGLERWRQSKVVVDPVMVAASGDKLLAADG